MTQANMPRHPAGWRRAALAVGLAFVTALPATAQDRTDLTPDELRQIAAIRLSSGDPATAAQMADALLARNPDDLEALTIRARAALETGDWTTARRALSRLYRAPGADPGQRYSVARLAAFAAMNEDRLALAQFWLRMALTQAEGDEQIARTTQDAAHVRSLSPWRTDINLTFAPSDNVNNGSRSDTYTVNGEDIYLFGLPFRRTVSPRDQALSGWVGSADLRLSYALPPAATHRNTLSFRLSHRAVALSEEAQQFLDDERAPDQERITSSDFNTSLLELGFDHDRRFGNGLAQLGVAAGAFWSRGAHDHDYLRFSARTLQPLGPTAGWRASAFAEQRWPVDSADERRFGTEVGYDRTFEGIGRFGIGLGWQTLDHDSAAEEYDSWTLRLSYAPDRAIGPATLRASMQYQITFFPDYEEYRNLPTGEVELSPIPGGREDRALSATLEAVFDGWSYAGFSPVLTLDAGRTTSNVSRFDGENLGLGFGLRSTF